MTLDALYVYPLKSARGVAVAAADVDAGGLALDRRWAAVDVGGRVLSRGEVPRLALVGAVPEGDALRVEAPGSPPLVLPLDRPPAAREGVTVWGDPVRAHVYGDAEAAWLSRALGVPCRLVCFPDDARATRPAFTDGYPVHLLTRASLEDLNGRLAEPAGVARFRPNVVVSGSAPYAEDGWAEVHVGPVRLRRPLLTPRCSVTTVDPETAAVGKEPLRTLARYRRREAGVVFGVYLAADGPGRLRVGDAVRASGGAAPAGGSATSQEG